MAWSLNDRGLFAALPPRLPEAVQPLLDQFTHLEAESKALHRKASELRKQREQVRRDHEAAIATAMLEGRKKLPVDPLPDYDQSIQGLDHQSAGARRAAAQVYAQLGAALAESKAEDTAALRDDLGQHLGPASEAVDTLRPLLDQVTETLALIRWHAQLTPYKATTYAAVTPESKVIDQALGNLTSVLRRLAHDLAEAESKRAPEPVEVPA